MNGLTHIVSHLHTDIIMFTLYIPPRSNPESAPNVLLAVVGVISNRPALCNEPSSLLMDIVEGYTATLLGQEPQPAPSASSSIVQTLLGSSHPDLPLAAVLSVSHVVDSIMALYWDGLTDAVSSKLVALIDGLFEHFHRYACNNLCDDLQELDFAPATGVM